VQFVDENRAQRLVKSEYPNAALTRDDAGLKSWAHQVRELVAGEKNIARNPARYPRNGLPAESLAATPENPLRRDPYVQRSRRSHGQAVGSTGRRHCLRFQSSGGRGSMHRVVHKGGNATGYRWALIANSSFFRKKLLPGSYPPTLSFRNTTARTLLCVQ